MNRCKRSWLLVLSAAFLVTSLAMPAKIASAQNPLIAGFGDRMRSLVIQSVTTGINSVAWVDETDVQTGNDGTMVDDGTGEVDPDQVADAVDVPPADPSTPMSLKPKDKGPEVKALQQRLMELQFLEDDDASGTYNNTTTEAVKLFQRTNKLTIDGIAGPETYALLFSSNALKYSMKQGDSGTDVASMQRRLKALKYFNGSATGYFSAATTAAIKAFQERNGLTVDGKAGSKTRDLLYSSKAKANPVSTAPPKNTTTTNNAPSTNEPTTAPSKDVAGFLSFAQAQLGKKYVSGNEGPTSFDCSGYVYYCLKNAGVNIGRMSSASYADNDNWTSIKKSELRAGDLLFFGLSGSKNVRHVGIYMGGNRMIHCSSSKGQVVITDINGSYWIDNYKSAKRVYK